MGNLFISHRKVDAPRAECPVHELTAAGHDVRFDEWWIDIGDSIVERINQGLEGMSYPVLCYSAVGLSPCVNREWMPILARQLARHPVEPLPTLFSGNGNTVPAILADIKYANLVKDWDGGVQVLLRAKGDRIRGQSSSAGNRP
uniref:TIR domain-containing protein n=1 Tax=Candidatus Kentrum eta TaxID=2126337 RepID=A0A450UFT3_9GAMM|nr:MAG: TIR domain-containing protein [Candidatus Kentron sp. H]VFJ91348.1 MAG: TIR domain-containing protein [Candidatus Kentron sp. H]VFJ97873.1 MAG: TIR domain-containing protein [Candidatus Kentron sp. H]